MKKNLILALSAAIALGSCDTYTGSGAYVGASFGSILGSAIGGLSDGPRGSDMGTIIGMAGGAIVGAAIGQAADLRNANAKDERCDRPRRQGNRGNSSYENNAQRQTPRQSDMTYSQQGDEESGFNKENSGDDRIYDFTSSDYTGSYSAQQPTTVMPDMTDVDKDLVFTPHLEVRDARFVDDNRDNAISRGEVCKVIFEVVNKGNHDVTDVQPTVWETTGNHHIKVSPGIHVERIAPGKGVRYTAIVQADNRLREGSVSIHVAVLQGDKAVSKVAVFNIPTKK